MGDRWTPLAIELRGFLGALSPLRLDLHHPLVILLGPNGSGKSTVVGAIEWVLFGDLALGDVEIAELKGPGLERYRACLARGGDEAEVCLRLSRHGSTLEWRRLRRRAKPRPEDDLVECRIDGRAVPPDPVSLLGVGHDLYVRAIAPRQGALAALVSRESKERNAALDRLLGIEQLNTLCEGLGKARGELGRERQKVEESMETALADLRREVGWRFDRRREARERALAAGVGDDLSLPGARALAATLAEELGVDPPSPEATRSDLGALHRRLEQAAEAAWTRPAATGRHARLLQLEALLRDQASAWRRARDRVEEARRELDRQERQETVAERERAAALRLDEASRALEQASAHAALLARAREWLARHEHEAGVDCPLCARPIGMAQLKEAVEGALSRLEAEDGELHRLRRQEEDARAQLDQAREARARLASACKDHDRAAAEEEERRRDLVQALGEAWPDREPDEIERPVVEALAEAGGAGADDLDRRLQALESAVADALPASQEELDRASEAAATARRGIIALGRLLELLEADEQLAALDHQVAGGELARARRRSGR